MQMTWKFVLTTKWGWVKQQTSLLGDEMHNFVPYIVIYFKRWESIYLIPYLQKGIVHHETSLSIAFSLSFIKAIVLGAGYTLYVFTTTF